MGEKTNDERLKQLKRKENLALKLLPHESSVSVLLRGFG